MQYLLLLAFVLLLIPFTYFTYKYRNPYKLIMVFGKKGSGKTTFLAKKSYQYLKKGRPVYTTEYIPGTIHFDVEQIGFITFPRIGRPSTKFV